MNSLNNINIKEFLNKLLANDLSEKEQEKLRNYIGNSYKNEQLERLMLQHWTDMDNVSLYNKSSLENVKLKLWAMIQKESSEQRQSEKIHSISWQTILIRIAAVLFIPLLVYTGFLFSQQHFQKSQPESVMQKVVANPGSRIQFTLPDQTRVWLNSGSSLEYQVDMNRQSQRNVKLTGQGYFKVAHSSKQPFLVEANQLKIKVMGTSFDVSNYLNDGKIISTLEEGSIAILDSRGEEVATLKPGQQATLNKQTKKLIIEQVDTRLSTSWKDGRLIFRDSSLPEVAKSLERWFNCSIEVENSLLNTDIKYTATIQDETLGEVLQMIELSTSVKTSVKNRKVYIWAK